MVKARFLSVTRSGLVLSALAVLLAACSVKPSDEISPAPSSRPERLPSLLASYDFHWQLSGQRDVAPLQVFNDERQIWLQYAPGQAVPAIFGVYQGRAEPLSPQRHGSYVTVPGPWPELQFRGGALLARAVYGVSKASDVSASNDVDGATDAVAASNVVVEEGRALTAARGRVKAVVTTDGRDGALTTSPSDAATGFVTLDSDDTMRRVLTRWAAAAGWTFRREHWAVDVDIPLSGQARFNGGFQRAVRGLLASTEMGDRPLQPCFYANRVLRVIALAQPCDRRRRGQALAS